MKKQPIFRPVEDGEVMATKLQQGELWESSRVRPADAESRHLEEQMHTSESTPQKPSREETQIELMERARRLRADPNYPTDQIIQELADMLARHWYSKS